MQLNDTDALSNQSPILPSPLMNPPRTQLPDTLVQHAARELLQRTDVIKLTVTTLREISPAPLPSAELTAAYPKAQVSQWQLSETPAAVSTWTNTVKKFNPFKRSTLESQTWTDFAPSADAQLVIAPFVLEGLYAGEVLAHLSELPQWFTADGVLMFALLGAGAAPELVNRDPEWLVQLKHLPNIMDTGARLQALNFGLPVLDVETVRLGYSDAQTLWQDVLNLSPSLQGMSAAEQSPWREKIDAAFADGMNELSLEIIYGQVWQPSARRSDDGVRTVSLESLTNSLKK